MVPFTQLGTSMHINVHPLPKRFMTHKRTTITFLPIAITKRQVERCIHELSEHWSDQELNDVIDMFQTHGLL